MTATSRLPAVVARSASWDAPGRTAELSVIVPVYNTAPYVRSALDSLVPFETDAVEIVVVHDGGSDDSLAIATAWVEAAPVAAVVVDQANAGLSAARMTGLAHATGRSIGFLDSDDLADAEVLLAMARDIERAGCDVVLCRSVVLDGANLLAAPFYDDWIWDAMLGPSSFRKVTLEQEPRLLRLEPNANTRVIRRTFMDRQGISFPIGKLFEDPPAHAKGVMRAAAVGLRGETGYFYRVNRPGKITDERSARRFDAIETSQMAIGEAIAAGVAPEAGACLVLALARLLFWCCQNVTNANKLRFAADAARALRTAPAQWLDVVSADRTLHHREALLFAALRHGAPRLIAAAAARQMPPPGAMLSFLLSPYGRPGWQMVRATLLRRPARLLRRLTGRR